MNNCYLRRLVLVFLSSCAVFSGCRPEPKVVLSDVQNNYYVDSEKGNDLNDGKSIDEPWKSLKNFSELKLMPGDSVKFKRGSGFSGLLLIDDSGTENNYIVFTAYGSSDLPAPEFTNPLFENGNFGNCIRLKGEYIKVENLYFEGTPSFPAGFPDAKFLTIWEMGAIHIDRAAQHCIVTGNELRDCPAAIKSNGRYITISDNYIHDCNRILKEWGWGPLGIWIGNDHQTIIGNRIINYRVEDPRIKWSDGIGGGADGGAMEIDDARYNKTDITIAYNYTRDCQGFLEVTYRDVQNVVDYSNFKIHHNISDDYQQFVALWAGRKCYLENNTIIRRKVNVNDWGVFNIAQNNSGNFIRNNIIVTEKEIPVFNVGLQGTSVPKSVIENNLCFAASGNLDFGPEGEGRNTRVADPLFKNYASGTNPEDFELEPGSPAIGSGEKLGYDKDFFGKMISGTVYPDLGAIESGSN